jgi:hypothetical protein
VEMMFLINPRTGTKHNVLYHVRKQDTKIGKDKTLLIEEIQSDWHQAGRKQGYKGEYKEIDELTKANK